MEKNAFSSPYREQLRPPRQFSRAKGPAKSAVFSQFSLPGGTASLNSVAEGEELGSNLLHVALAGPENPGDSAPKVGRWSEWLPPDRTAFPGPLSEARLATHAGPGRLRHPKGPCGHLRLAFLGQDLTTAMRDWKAGTQLNCVRVHRQSHSVLRTDRVRPDGIVAYPATGGRHLGPMPARELPTFALHLAPSDQMKVTSR